MKKKILIVEDNPDLNKMLQLLLQNSYYTISAIRGKRAVDMAAVQLPDLILMDIMMPEMDGLQATRLIRQNPKTRSIPIIVVIAMVGHIYEEECFQSGCDDYFVKPFTAEQLVTRIEKLLKQ